MQIFVFLPIKPKNRIGPAILSITANVAPPFQAVGSRNPGRHRFVARTIARILTNVPRDIAMRRHGDLPLTNVPVDQHRNDPKLPKSKMAIGTSIKAPAFHVIALPIL
jgi:hypothetical protein